MINVGNITVGGTGKTTIIEYMVELLKGNFFVATLSRGYKRKTMGFVLADSQSNAFQIGDEPRQIKQKFPEVPVAVDSKRVRGITKLLGKFDNLDVVLLDDAFQHRYVTPGLSILLMDYNHLITRDYILPIGRLREPAYESRRANFVIITKCPDQIKPIERRIIQNELGIYPYQKLYFTKIAFLNPQPVFSGKRNEAFKDMIFKIKPHVLLVTGIAKPMELKEFAGNISKEVTEIKFPDHHFFSKNDIAFIHSEYEKIENPDKIILTTEKDAARFQALENLPSEIRENMFYIPISIEFLFNQQKEFNKHIYEYINKNDKYRKISATKTTWN